MTVDVLYEGFAIARGLESRPDGERLFVVTPQPMPVGTWLTLVEPGQAGPERSARVERVRTGSEAGMWVSFSTAPSDDTDAPPPAGQERRARPRRRVHKKSAR